MDRRSILVIATAILVISAVSPPTVHGNHGGNERRPENAERVVGISSRWGTAVSWAKLKLAGGAGEDKGDERKEETGDQEPNPAERAMGVGGAKSRWDAFKTWVELKLVDVRRPTADSRPDGSESSIGDVMKEAATKSLETSREAAELSAKSAADAMDEAVFTAKERVKGSAITSSTAPKVEEDL